MTSRLGAIYLGGSVPQLVQCLGGHVDRREVTVSRVSSMEMTRPPAGSSETSAFSDVVLSEPVPPEIGRFRSRPDHGCGFVCHRRGE